jgi:hypothetical protein
VNSKPVDIEAAEAILKARTASLIKPGDRLDQSFFDWCKTTQFALQDILSLFVKTDGERAYYECQCLCLKCGKSQERSWSKSDVRDFIAAVRRRKKHRLLEMKFDCDDCQAEEREERKRQISHAPEARAEILKQEREARRAIAVANTELFFSKGFLVVGQQWNPEFPAEQRFPAMIKGPVADDMIAAAISELSAEDFWHTPYWAAVETEVRRQAEGRCSLCASSGPLQIHFRTKERHGYEHTEQGLRDILCLCRRCRETVNLTLPPAS